MRTLKLVAKRKIQQADEVPEYPYQIIEGAKDADTKRNIDWIKSDNVRRIQGSGRTTTGEEIIFSPRQNDIDIARLQHRGLSDIEE